MGCRHCIQEGGGGVSSNLQAEQIEVMEGVGINTTGRKQAQTSISTYKLINRREAKTSTNLMKDDRTMVFNKAIIKF